MAGRHSIYVDCQYMKICEYQNLTKTKYQIKKDIEKVIGEPDFKKEVSLGEETHMGKYFLRKTKGPDTMMDI